MIWRDFVQATHSPLMIVHRLYVIVLGYVTFEINKFFVDIT